MAPMDTEDAENPTKPSAISFDDLPREVKHMIISPLRLEDRRNARLCNRELEEAVATSTWSTPNVRVIIEAKDGDEAEFEVNLTWDDTEKHPLSANHLPRWRYCKNLKVHDLRLYKVPLYDASMQSLNSFLDICDVDLLSLQLPQDQRLNSRIHELIAKQSQSEHVTIMGALLNLEEYLSISRPIVFQSQAKFDSITSPEDEAHFLKLLRMGHNFCGMIKIENILVQTIVEAIEIMCDLPYGHELVLLTSHSVGEAFVSELDADLVSEMTNDHYPIHETRREYKYQQATIVLKKRVRAYPLLIKDSSEALFFMPSKLYNDNMLLREEM